MPDLHYVTTNRYLCDILEEMRTCIKVLNFAPLLSLIEELQVNANRMEKALEQHKDIPKLHEDLYKLKDARRALKKEVKDLIKKVDKGLL